METLQITKIHMGENIKKILFPLFIIIVLSFFIFLGLNYTKSNLASFSGIIEAWVRINPLEVEVFAPVQANLNKNFQVKAEIANKSSQKIENVEAEIFLPEGLSLQKKDSKQGIGALPGNKTKTVFWQVRGERLGNYIISVIVSGILNNQQIFAQDSLSIEINPSSLPRRWLEELGNFFRLRL